jgi:hypothetical protein
VINLIIKLTIESGKEWNYSILEDEGVSKMEIWLRVFLIMLSG